MTSSRNMGSRGASLACIFGVVASLGPFGCTPTTAQHVGSSFECDEVSDGDRSCLMWANGTRMEVGATIFVPSDDGLAFAVIIGGLSQCESGYPDRSRADLAESICSGQAARGEEGMDPDAQSFMLKSWATILTTEFEFASSSDRVVAGSVDRASVWRCNDVYEDGEELEYEADVDYLEGGRVAVDDSAAAGAYVVVDFPEVKGRLVGRSCD